MNEGRKDLCVCGEAKEDHFLISINRKWEDWAGLPHHEQSSALLCPKYTFHTDPEEIPNWYRHES